MDELIQKASSQVVSFAIKSGVSIASGYALKTLRGFVHQVPKDRQHELQSLESKLRATIQVLVPAIDLVEVLAARSSTFLESSVDLARALRKDIDRFNGQVEGQSKELERGHDSAIGNVERFLKDLDAKINGLLPILNLSLVTFSAANTAIGDQSRISPGLLLHASRALAKADDQFQSRGPVPVGSRLSLVYYTIFYSSLRSHHLTLNDLTWKEQFARADVQVMRVPSTDAQLPYAYKLSIRENFDDGRVHDEEPNVESIAIEEVEKMYFSDAGAILELADTKTPVIILKTRSGKWVALQLYQSSSPDSDISSDEESLEEGDPHADEAAAIELANSMAGLDISEPAIAPLRYLEYLVRLCALQTADQSSIYGATDEKLRMYLQQTPGVSTTRSDEVDEQTPRSKRVYRSPLTKSGMNSPSRMSAHVINAKSLDTPVRQHMQWGSEGRSAETTAGQYTK